MLPFGIRTHSTRALSLAAFVIAGTSLSSSPVSAQTRMTTDSAGQTVDCSARGGRAVPIAISFPRNAADLAVFPLAQNVPATGGVLLAQFPGGPPSCGTGSGEGDTADECCTIVSNQSGGGSWTYTPVGGNPAASALRFQPLFVYSNYGSCVYHVFSDVGTIAKPEYVTSSPGVVAVGLRPVAFDDVNLQTNTFFVGDPIEIDVFQNDLVGDDGDATLELGDYALLSLGLGLTAGPFGGPIVFTVGTATYLPPNQVTPPNPSGRPKIRIQPGFTGCGVGEVRYRLVGSCRQRAIDDEVGDVFSLPADHWSNPATVKYRVIDPSAPPPTAQVDAPPAFTLGGPYLVDILGNDDLLGDPVDAQVQVLGGATGGAFTWVAANGQVPGHLKFVPSFSSCGTGTCLYRVTDACGGVSLPTAVSVSIVLAEADCDQNCVPDVVQSDCDENGIPDACDGPCGDCNINRRNPGSLLLYPVFDDRATNSTLAAITNTTTAGVPGPGGLLGGTVDVEFVFISRYGPQGQDLQCVEWNATRRLTPGDTFAFFTRALNPNQGRGFFYAFAKSPTTGKAIVFNHLIGSTLSLSALDASTDSVDAISFAGIGSEGASTDVDLDGTRDLDGEEYAPAPGEILIPRFMGQDPPGEGPGIRSRLVLIGLTGGTDFTTQTHFQVFNDNEVALSATKNFRCWESFYLTEINLLFLNSYLQDSTLHDLDEVFGANERESGWIRITGQLATSTAMQIDDPIVYAVLFEGGSNYTTATLPFEGCGNPNGDLYPTGPLGDF